MTQVIRIDFTHRIVDWVNANIPERNWFMMDGFQTTEVGQDMFSDRGLYPPTPIKKETTYIEAEQYHLNRYNEDHSDEIEIFFIQSESEFQKIITEVCYSILDETNAMDIYLLRLNGILEYSGDNTLFARWELIGYFNEVQ